MKHKIQDVDFIMIYEHKVRELENLCLIKCELEKRGYSVLIFHIEDPVIVKAVKPLYRAKAVMLMACYRNSTLEWHTKDFVIFDRVIDMQWENIVYPKDEKAGKVFKNYSGIGKEVVRVSWGNANRRRLLETAKMDPKKIKLVGHVGMDFLRDELKGYYLSKEELFPQYQIPMDKKTILFASPFYADNLPEDYIKDMCSRFGEDWREYYAFMMKSEECILEWFKKLCKDRDDVQVIYRPHPGHIGEKMSEVAEQCDNFMIISDKSIKQWILTCDIIYTGNSSTFVEAFFARKACHLLFPFEVTEGYELTIIRDAKKITTYDEFYGTIDSVQSTFPVPESAIDDVYTVDWDKPSYVKFADMAEEVINDPYYQLSKEQLKSYRTKHPLPVRIQRKLVRIDFLYDIYLKAINNSKWKFGWLEKQRKIRQESDAIAAKLQHESTSIEEIRQIQEKIKKQLKEAERNE